MAKSRLDALRSVAGQQSEVQPALSTVLRRAERALEGELAEVTVADVVQSVSARARRPAGKEFRKLQ